MTITLWIAGKARGKDRPRHRPGAARPFTPKATVNAEANIAAVWREAGEPRMPEGPIELIVGLTVLRPAGHYRKSGELSASGLREPAPSRQKPDVDNALKLVMDALNGRAYRDDVQVVSATIRREWGDVPGTRIEVRSAVASAA